MKVAWLVVGLVFLAAAGPVAAATNHVAVDGDNRGPGTAAAPWQTLQRAVDAAGPGDVIVVHEGTYAGARIERSGQRRRPITLRAAAGEAVVLDRPSAQARHGSILEVENFRARVRNWVIVGFEIAGAPRSGIDVRVARRITLRGNRVHDSGRSGIFTAFARRVSILENESFANGEHGIYVSNSGDRPLVRENLIYDNAASGIHMNGDLSQGGDGIIRRARINRNVIFGNGRLGGSGINLDGVEFSWVLNNLLFDEHASGISLFQGDGAVCSRRNRVFFNTVLVAADGRWALNMPGSDCTRNRVVNNVLLSAHPFRGSIAVSVPLLFRLDSDHNAVTDRFSVDGGETVISFAEWRALGHDGESVLATPEELFVDPEGGDFSLRCGSPARDAGRSLRAVHRDLAGAPRRQGAGWDLGALEAADDCPD